jgi:hypothetical protein
MRVDLVVPRLLGERLLAAARVTEDQLRSALVRQSSELVYEVLRWQKGRFAFRRRPPSATAAAAKLGLSVPAVLMEGFRRIDEWRGLEGKIGSIDDVLARASRAPGADQLTKPEAAVLGAIDGARTIREVIVASRMVSLDACRLIEHFVATGWVERKG